MTLNALGDGANSGGNCRRMVKRFGRVGWARPQVRLLDASLSRC
jgi:hypothetical protein